MRGRQPWLGHSCPMRMSVTGLPIGGVLAASTTPSSPMRSVWILPADAPLEIYEVSPHLIGQKKGQFENALGFKNRLWHGRRMEGEQTRLAPVLDDPSWEPSRLLKSCRITPTSLGPAHATTCGVGLFHLDETLFGLQPGDYLALLRTVLRSMVKIADRFSKLAMELHPTSIECAALGLAVADRKRAEYWAVDGTSGAFASASHYVIIHRVAAAMGQRGRVVETSQTLLGESAGYGQKSSSTSKRYPAGVGVLGVIPGRWRCGLCWCAAKSNRFVELGLPPGGH